MTASPGFMDDLVFQVGLGPWGWCLAIEAFFDDTVGQMADGRPTFYATAGVLFDRAGAQRFAEEWAKICPPLEKPFHATECASGRGQFQSWGKARCNALLDDLAQLIADTRGPLAVVSATTPENYRAFVDRNPAAQAAVPNPFTLCLLDSINMVGKWLAESGATDDVAYVFESGSDGEMQASAFLRRAAVDSRTRSRFRIMSYAFTSKSGAAPLIAADYLAWECQRSATRKQDWPPRFAPVIGDPARPILVSEHSVESATMWAMHNWFHGLHEDAEAL